jgi:hypothetical protein
MTMIGEKVFNQLANMTEELISEHATRITKAFSLRDDDKMTVGITLTIAPGKTMDQYDLDASITYSMEKVKEKITAKVTENQADLPLVDKVYQIKGE